VTGLGLGRFQGHAGLSQPGEAGVPQLMAGQVRDVGAGAGPGHDLVQAGRGQRPAASRPLQHHVDGIYYLPTAPSP
jgi:hypothetical protein